jgi:hypothetical protein
MGVMSEEYEKMAIQALNEAQADLGVMLGEGDLIDISKEISSMQGIQADDIQKLAVRSVRILLAANLILFFSQGQVDIPVDKIREEAERISEIAGTPDDIAKHVEETINEYAARGLIELKARLDNVIIPDYQVQEAAKKIIKMLRMNLRLIRYLEINMWKGRSRE